MDQAHSMGAQSKLTGVARMQVALLVALALMAVPALALGDWRDTLEQRLSEIDSDYQGELGVFVQDLGSGESVSLRDDEPWYLASMIKVPVAVAVLEQVDAGELALDDRVELRASDFVDGAGETNWNSPGDRVSVRFLFEQMLVHSDNTATDVLIRMVGLEQVNAVVRSTSGEDMGPVTTLADVRRYAYSYFHDDAMELASDGFFAIKKAGPGEQRVAALSEVLGVPASEFNVADLDAAFDQYYQSGRNAGRLSQFARVWSALAEGSILEPDSRDYLLDTLESVQTGDNRVKAGLPGKVRFTHKTGTQHRRACNMGLASANGAGQQTQVIIGVCARDYVDLAETERAMRRVGEAVGESGLFRF